MPKMASTGRNGHGSCLKSYIAMCTHTSKISGRTHSNSKEKTPIILESMMLNIVLNHSAVSNRY